MIIKALLEEADDDDDGAGRRFAWRGFLKHARIYLHKILMRTEGRGGIGKTFVRFEIIDS